MKVEFSSHEEFVSLMNEATVVQPRHPQTSIRAVIPMSADFECFLLMLDFVNKHLFEFEALRPDLMVDLKGRFERFKFGVENLEQATETLQQRLSDAPF